MEIAESRAPLGVDAVTTAARSTAWSDAAPLLLPEVATLDSLTDQVEAAGSTVAVVEKVSAGFGALPQVPSGAALWISLALDLDGVTSERRGWLVHAVALAAVDALREAGRVPAEIVWPTTLSVPGAMCGGDAGTRAIGCVDVRPAAGGGVVATVGVLAGLGMLELPRSTTSVYADGGDIDRAALLAAYLPALERRLAQWRAADPALALAYRDRCQTLGRLVEVEGRQGRVRRVDDAGRLVIDVDGEDVVVAADAAAPVLL